MTDEFEKYWAPSTRFTIPESWWVASELQRRNPSLILIETHPGGGQYDCLSLFTAHGSNGPVIHLNRGGSISVFDENFQKVFGVTWGEVFANDGPHRVVKQIEQAFPVTRPQTTPATTRRTVGPRVISAFLSATVHARDPWDARNAFNDSSGGYGGVTQMLAEHGLVAELGSAYAQFTSTEQAAWFFETPEYAYWGLMHQDKCVAVVCPDGTVCLRGKEPLDIYAHYREHASIGATATAVLAYVTT